MGAGGEGERVKTHRHSSVVIARGKGVGEVEVGKGEKDGMERDFALDDGAQCSVQMMFR